MIDVLERLLSERLEVQTGSAPHRMMHVPGDAYAAGPGQRPHPRGHVHAVAGDAGFVERHVALVDADAQPQVGVTVELGLCGERAVHRIECAREGGQRLVAGALDPLAVMPLDQRTKNHLVAVSRTPGRLLVPRHQGGVAHDVGEHDGGEAAFPGSAGHGSAA